MIECVHYLAVEKLKLITYYLVTINITAHATYTFEFEVSMRLKHNVNGFVRKKA